MTRLVLVGGGHAHLHVLAQAVRRPVAGRRVTLVSLATTHHYSGMVPGFLQAAYEEADLRFDLGALCARAGVTFHAGAAEIVDPRTGWVVVGNQRLPFDQCSLDVGAEAGGLDVPGVREHACSVRPMSRAVELRRRLEALAASARGGTAAAVVVGGGDAGVEVALALHRRLADAGVAPRITVVEARAQLLPSQGPRFRARVAALLAQRGIAVRPGRTVTRVGPSGLVLDDGGELTAELVVWLTGAAAPAVVRNSAVPHDAAGFLRVGPALRAVDGSAVWGAGDCVALDGHPHVAKAGVYAVREAPVLDHNLRAAVSGAAPRSYRPQRDFLALLNTADGKALLRWHGVVLHTRWAWRLKDAIDRRFVAGYTRVATAG